MDITLQLTSGKSYVLNFQTFVVKFDGEVKTVPITATQLDILESDSGVRSLIDSGELIVHKKAKDDSTKPASKKRNASRDDFEDI